MKIAVLGYGTIGSGVVEIVNTNAAYLAEKCALLGCSLYHQIQYMYSFLVRH